MGANSYQIGGAHYKTSYEHWDFCIDLPVDYLAGCATKYVARHRKKKGVEDLKKALHYVNKMIEAFLVGRLEAPGLKHPPGFHLDPYQRFVKANRLTAIEADATCLLVSWSEVKALYAARDLILHLMDEREPLDVPLTEENHYSPRVGEEQE